jgi:hypothetical protein
MNNMFPPFTRRKAALGRIKKKYEGLLSVVAECGEIME